MITKEKVEQEVFLALHELFEIPMNDLGLDKHIAEDLMLDSIDAVDLIVRLQDRADVKVNPEEFKSIRTVRDIVDVVTKLVHAA